MKDKIQAAIASAREKNKGKIAPASDIYEAIFRAGYEQCEKDMKLQTTSPEDIVFDIFDPIF